MSQGVGFMRQWIWCFSLTHKGFITNLTKTYLKSKGMKLGTWLVGIKNGRRSNILGLFLLCVMNGMHCFVHTKVGIWTTLLEEPKSHQTLIQWCNLHLEYLGNRIYVEFMPRTEVVSFQIFGVPEPINVDMDSKPVAIGTLSSDEQETLHTLLSTGITLSSATPSTSIQVVIKHPSTPLQLSAEESSTYPESDSGLPYSKESPQQMLPQDNNAKLAQQDSTLSAQHYTSDEDTVQPRKMNN